MNLERFQHYKLGYEAIDAEHLVIMLIMEEAFVFSKERDIPALDDCISRLRVCLTEHFQHEERLMDEINYPFKDWHKEVHTSIGRRLTDMFSRYSQNGNSIFAHIQLTKDLEIIIAHHIDETDRQLVEHLNK